MASKRDLWVASINRDAGKIAIMALSLQSARKPPRHVQSLLAAALQAVAIEGDSFDEDGVYKQRSGYGVVVGGLPNDMAAALDAKLAQTEFEAIKSVAKTHVRKSNTYTITIIVKAPPPNTPPTTN